MALFKSIRSQQPAIDYGDKDEDAHKDQRLSDVWIQATSESLRKTPTDACMKGLNNAKAVKAAKMTLVSTLSTDATKAPDTFDIFQSIKETTRIRIKLDDFFDSVNDGKNYIETIKLQRQLAEVINKITNTDRTTMLKVLKSLVDKNIDLLEDIVRRTPVKVNLSILNSSSHSGFDSISEIGKPDQGSGVLE